MTSPPMVGVPALLRCRSGVSSRMVSPPCWRARSRRISQGPRTKEITIAVTVAIALPWLDAKGIQVPLAGNGIPATLAGVVAAVAIFGLIGVGLGALVREQVATVVGLLVYLFIAEPIVTRIPALSSWTIYLPGAAANALTQVAQANQDFLPPWQGGLVLAAYGLILAAAGTFLTTRRDIT